MNIPDHLYESEWANQSGYTIEQTGLTGDDFADPDTEPIPGLDEAIEHVKQLLMQAYPLGSCGVCSTGYGSYGQSEGHIDDCPIAAAEAWVAAKTNDERSDLPW